MRQKAKSKLVAFVICFLCLPVLTSCGMYGGVDDHRAVAAGL